MSVADKVGQLFLIAFQGDEVSPESEIAVLVRDYRVGGVVLLPANGNYRSVPVPAGVITGTSGLRDETTTTPAQIAGLVNALQALAFDRAAASWPGGPHHVYNAADRHPADHFVCRADVLTPADPCAYAHAVGAGTL